MIRTEQEYRRAVDELAQSEKRVAELKDRLRASGLSDGGLEAALEPVLSFSAGIADDVARYERLKRGDFGELHNLHGLGELLIALRIARGISQRELAARLDVHESVVSRDERNEYHGLGIARASRILDALEVDLTSHFATAILPKLPERSDDPVARA